MNDLDRQADEAGKMLASLGTALLCLVDLMRYRAGPDAAQFDADLRAVAARYGLDETSLGGAALLGTKAYT